MFAIVDIETTGGYASGNRITEICILESDGKQILGRYHTLIHPQRPIPPYIKALTGITDEMVASAPPFEKVADQIFSRINGKIFVAHNVNFDYSFLYKQFRELGYSLQCRKLCTIRYSRHVFPGLPSYGLDKLCRYLNIPLNNAHRAYGDAEATAMLFHLLLSKDKNDYISACLLRHSKEHILPPGLPAEQITSLPEKTGVYYFHDKKGKIIYIGKASNIRKRVISHFSNHSGSVRKQFFMNHIRKVTFELCASYWMASILESAEIKKYRPLCNISQNRYVQEYGIYRFEDGKGYLRLAIDKKRKNIPAVFTSHSYVHILSVLKKMAVRFQLCPILCFLQTKGSCTGTEEGYCSGACCGNESAAHYNQRVIEACRSFTEKQTFIILDKGLSDNESFCLLVENGRFFGMGYLPASAICNDPETIKSYLTVYPENGHIRNSILDYVSRFPEKVIRF
ncbi:MAG: exonuclease domain-containing protein [Chitinophagaceae bacterium]|nr:exonuclease domain-containing protein [Chitinophagaceae bacterium]